MMNRERFWKYALPCLLTAALLGGCMAPPAPAPGIHRGPVLSRPVVTPPPSNSARTITTADGATVTPQKTVRIGLLVPLTGREAELGRALRDAATVSLFDKYTRLSARQQGVRVELLPRDTGDTPQQAAEAMEHALADGAAFIIGPLFAEATSAAAPRARAKDVSVLSLSNTRTQASPGTYMFGFSPAEQAERVVSYAIAAGKPRIAVLAPGDALGNIVLTAARNAARHQGFELAAEATYLPQGADIEGALNRLMPPGTAPAFDALLIPEGGPALDTLLRGLSARGVTPGSMQFLGIGLWDDVELLQRVALDKAWVASSPPELTGAFDRRFRETYGYTAPRIASLAYDAVALAVTLATSGRPFDAATLTQKAGFSGPTNGIFRLRANGLVQRGLAVMEVHGRSLRVISPAPAGF